MGSFGPSSSTRPAMPTRLARSRARGPRNWFDKTSNIELRRFAGTLRHAQQLTTPLRIAHVTDQHVGRVTPMRVQMAAVELINERRPDLVCVTGDFVCHSQAYLDALSALIKPFNVNVASLVSMFTVLIGGDQSAPCYGDHHLEDFFRARVAERRAAEGEG